LKKWSGIKGSWSIGITMRSCHQGILAWMLGPLHYMWGLPHPPPAVTRQSLQCGERIKAYENWTQAWRDAAHLLFQDWHSPGSRTAVSPKLFAFREAGTQVFPITMSCPSLRTAAPPPCLPLGIKKL
jgi:hypothetical protein